MFQQPFCQKLFTAVHGNRRHSSTRTYISSMEVYEYIRTQTEGAKMTRHSVLLHKVALKSWAGNNVATLRS